MFWLHEHQRVWSLAVLVLLLIAFAGPWSFDLINVPSEYSCSAPFIRLKGDFCGVPLSGTWIFLGLVGQFISIVGDFVGGTMAVAELGRGLPVLLASALFLPFFSTVLRILPRDHPRPQMLHLVVWGLAAVSVVWWLLLSPAEWLPSPLWGRWLFFGLALGMLVVEAVLVVSRRPWRPP